MVVEVIVIVLLFLVIFRVSRIFIAWFRSGGRREKVEEARGSFRVGVYFRLGWSECGFTIKKDVFFGRKVKVLRYSFLDYLIKYV